MFTRSLQLELHRVGFGPDCIADTGQRDPTTCAPRGSSSDACSSTHPEETIQSFDCLAQGAQSLASPAVVRGMVEVPLLYDDQMPPSPPIRALSPPQYVVKFAADRGRAPGVEDAESTALTSRLNGQLCFNAERERAAVFVRAPDARLTAPTFDLSSEEIRTGSATRNPCSAHIDEGHSQTTSAQGMANSDISTILLSDDMRFDHGVGASGAPGVEDTVNIVDKTSGDGLGFLKRTMG